MNTLQQECYLAPFHILKVEMVGPKVGAELRNKAVLATLYALAGMLAYIWFPVRVDSTAWGRDRVLPRYAHHDRPLLPCSAKISMTVIAALLTLVGYSMTIPS